MYKVKIEFIDGTVMYYKLLTFSAVVNTIAESSAAVKINIWYKEPNIKEK